MRGSRIASIAGALALLLAGSAVAQTAPGPKVSEGDLVVRDFQFRSGEALAELRLHYRTLGQAKRDAAGKVTNAVMVLHGTGGSAAQFLRPQFAGELFGPGQPLDVAKFFIILPDGVGHGASSKPSDGLRAKFPHYDYDDMVEAHRRVLADLKVDRLRLVMGTSMGCMHIFVWAEAHPDFARAAMPMACVPVQIAGRNRLWRKMVMDAIVSDPDWKGGDYQAQPIRALRTAQDLLILAGSSPIPMQKELATRDAADKFYTERMAAALPQLDANDLLYQVDASRNYDPSPGLAKITVPMTWINSADDFINPPELGIAEREAARLKTARYRLIPASENTKGHGSHTWAVLWKDDLVGLLGRTVAAKNAVVHDHGWAQRR